MSAPTDPRNETCKYCPYARFNLDGYRVDCDPPMGECPLEQPQNSTEHIQRAERFACGLCDK